ncbi:MAG: hypothetical protein KDJ52_21225 [Anaerolineae bacterium]|nr:hypothetical protein [Anaerolineae bacterium]
MESITVSQGIVMLDPRLEAFADSIFATIRLASTKAVAHTVDSGEYPLPTQVDSFEQIFLTQFAQLRPVQQDAARALVMEIINVEKPVLRKRLGGFANVNLHSAIPITDQVSIPDIASRVATRRETRDALVSERNYLTSQPESLIARTMPEEAQASTSQAILTANLIFFIVDFIKMKYQELGGESGFLGPSLRGELVAHDKIGRYQMYLGGTIYYHPHSGAHEVHGAIRAKYESIGAEASPLGYPTTDESKTPDGKGRYNHFQNGSIYWTPEIGAHEVHGSIRKKWKSLGWEKSILGYPITDESKTPDGIGRYNHFQHGSIYWTPQTDAHEVHGAIRELWKSLGWEKSQLGYPVSDEMLTPDGKGRYSVFQNGTIYWYPDQGAYVGSKQPISKIAFRMLKVHCIDETGKSYFNWLGIKINGEKGQDDMFIGGTVIDTYGKISKVDKIPLGGYDDGTWSTFSPFHFFEFNINQQDNMWPKNFIITLVLVEQDSGGYSAFLNKLMDKLQPYVEAKLKEWFKETGFELGGPPGLALGSITGEVAAYVVQKIFNWLKDIWNDDIFIPITVNVQMPRPNALFDHGNYDSGDIRFWVKGHNGHYEWWGDWVVF